MKTSSAATGGQRDSPSEAPSTALPTPVGGAVSVSAVEAIAPIVAQVLCGVSRAVSAVGEPGALGT